MLALSSIPILFIYAFNSFAIGMMFAHSSPIIHVFLFKRLYFKFIESEGRAPVDVAFNFKKGLDNDRFFAFKVYLGFIFLSFFLVGIFHWGLALENS